MSNVFFDIRGGALKVLMTDGQAVKYSRIFESFSLEDTEGARKTLLRISDESGVKLDTVHLIPPAAEVKIKTYKLQKLSLEDARMIVRRRIMLEEGIEDPVFHLQAYGSGGRHQEFIAAIIDPEGLKKYVSLLSGYGIKVKMLSTSFHSKLKAFGSLKSDAPQTCAVFEVGPDAIEVMVVSPSGVVACEILPVSPEEDEEALEERDIERIQKKRLYGIVDALYKFMISYRENSADTPIERVLLCGLIDNMEKMAGAIEEAVGIQQASLWDPSGEATPDGAKFTALYGFSLGVADGTAVNLISAELLSGRKRARLSRAALAVFFFLYIAVLVSVCFIAETRYNNSEKILAEEIREKQTLAHSREGAGRSSEFREYLRRLAVKQPPLYGVFRYLGNDLPDGVSVEGIVFKQEGQDEILQLRFVSKYDVNVGRNRYFTRTIDSLRSSGRLFPVKEPAFSVSSDAKNSFIHFQITCKVIPYEKK